MRSSQIKSFVMAGSILVSGFAFSISAEHNGNHDNRNDNGQNYHDQNNHDSHNDYDRHDRDRRDYDRHDYDRHDNGRHGDHKVIVVHRAPMHRAPVVMIPVGYLPAPGMCRVWYRDRPDFHQPPPYRWHRYHHERPRDDGGYEVKCDRQERDRFRVCITDHGIDVAVQWYDNAGKFLFQE